MKLYGFGPMRSLRALWGLKELDTDFEFVHVRRKRRVYLRAADLRDRQRLGRPPSVNGAPTFVLTHKPPADYPCGPSNLTFVRRFIAGSTEPAESSGTEIEIEALKNRIKGRVDETILRELLAALRGKQ
jgi:hypothetical protein